MFEKISHEAIATQFETNVYGMMHTTRAALPVLLRQQAGHGFNISSIGAARGFDIASIYLPRHEFRRRRLSNVCEREQTSISNRVRL